MRQKFENNRHVKDPIKAKQLVEEAEEKFRMIRNPDPLCCMLLDLMRFLLKIINF